MRVVYLSPGRFQHPYSDDVEAALDGVADVSLHLTDDGTVPDFGGCSVVVEHGGQFSTPEMWQAAREAGVRLWQVTATGLDHMDVAAFLRVGIPLANMPGPSSTAIPMAEHTLALMLAVAKRLRASRRELERGGLYEPLTTELHGKALGLIGLGASGSEVSRRARAFGMTVYAVDAVEVPAALARELEIEFMGGPDALDEMLPLLDYVSLHVPLLAETRGILGREQLALLKPGAVVINVARGPLLDEAALRDALESGQVGGAGLDVFEREPTAPDNPLLAYENVIATPHNGVVSRELSVRRAGVVVDNVRRAAAGEGPLHLVSQAP